MVGNFDVGFMLYRNAGLAGAGNHWLTVRLEGRPPVNRDAIGARVFVTPGDGRPRMQEVRSGSSPGAGNDTALHFGLGGASIASVRVVWLRCALATRCSTVTTGTPRFTVLDLGMIGGQCEDQSVARHTCRATGAPCTRSLDRHTSPARGRFEFQDTCGIRRFR